MLIPSITRAHATTEHSEPKTILGFFLAYFAVMAAAVVAIVSALLATGHEALAAAVLVASFLASIAIPIWVALTHTKNPAALTIGESNIRDYLAVERWTAGDSSVGEYVAGTAGLPAPAPLLALPSSTSADEDRPASEQSIQDGIIIEDTAPEANREPGPDSPGAAG